MSAPAPLDVLLAEAARRRLVINDPYGRVFTLAGHAAGHAPQLAVMTDRAQRIHLMCARQSGKSQGLNGIGLDNCLHAPRSTNIYLGLNSPAVRTSIWEPVWLPLLDKWNLKPRSDKTRMMSEFPNGARIMFGGTDDLRHVKNYLGNRLDNGVVMIDESQDQAGSVLHYLLTVLLPPMLTPTSRVILSGTIPEVPAGLFYDALEDPSWSHHRWGRFANIHTPEARAQLERHLRDSRLTIDDPRIQRDYFGQLVFSRDATAYFYDRQRNSYVATEPSWLETARAALPCGTLMAAEPWRGLDQFSIAIDPGSRDRVAIEGIGWSTTDPQRRIQHLFEFASPRGARLAWGAIFGVAAHFASHYPTAQWRYDAGSSQNELDVVQRDYGIPVIRAALKSDLGGQVRRNNDLLEQGRFLVMRGSELETDYQRARWNQDARAAGRFEWAAAWHPDPSEAARYAIQGYFDGYEAAPPRPREEDRGFEPERPGDSWYERDMRDLGYDEQPIE